MLTTFSFQRPMRHRLVLAVVAGFTLAATAQSPAQSTAQTAPPAASSLFQLPPSYLAPSSTASTTDALFSSSADTSNIESGATAATMNLASLEKGFNLPGANAQYGRRRYGAPRYRGGNTNGDGSEKYTAYVGAGVAIPLGNTHHYDTPSWAFQVGVGRNFNKNFGVNVEFGWDEFGLQGSVLNQQAYIEDPYGSVPLEGNTDGYSHDWSFSLQPIYNITSGEGLGTYVTAGVGFYHKITTFTTPEEGEGYSYFGFPIEYVANTPFDSYTSNAPGVDGGVGVTYKFSRFANERFYAEVRYVINFNSQRTGITGSNYNNYSGSDYDYPTYNLYPANSNRTTYLPIKVGIRF